ncbi:MAG: hypothetical protein ACO1SV_17105 [Fimbriimonas sp.]
MSEAVRVVEYSFGEPEQRRSMAQSIAEQLEQGATVVGMVPVSLRTDGTEGDLITLRVAVFYLGGEETTGGGEAEAVASVGVEEVAAPSIVDDIMHIPEPEGP